MKNAVATAVNSGLADYANYIALQREKFRTDYINTCKLARANANLTAVQQVYHYTLYQYDQADNLVRTIPPEGVHLVDAGLFNYIDKARDLDTAAYSYTYNGPGGNSSLCTALNTLSATLAAPTGAVEMWLYNAGNTHYHFVETTCDRKYVYQVNVAGSKLNIDVYPMEEVTVSGMPSAHLLPATGHYQADIAALLPLYPFTHVVMQGNNLGAGTDLPQLYLNGHALTVTTHGTPAPVGFRITAGSTTISYPDSIQHLKHLRLYTHLLSQATITADANELFFNAHDTGYAGWYRFNTPAIGAPPTTINDHTSDEVAIYNLHPQHTLPTTYVYNSTNQVNLQQSPDGGVNRFWYDLLSRLTISQNDKQGPVNDYSYTNYDVLGRITEVGQKRQTTVSLGNPDYLADATINNFNTAGTNSQITKTIYDAPVAAGQNVLTGLNQQNLRKRVSASLFFDTQTGNVASGLYYNYDLDGNVKTLYRQIVGLGSKQIDYEYDLISGKVNFVRYQHNQPDRFYYLYNYDADNRLTQAWSGTTAMVDTLTHSSLLPNNGKMDAKYSYYLHGPLARMELGDTSRKVQGMDYAYTLQGWIKGVNSSYVLSSADMGRDSIAAARDAAGYQLSYYNGDYSPIGGVNPFESAISTRGGFSGLFNGNIAAMGVNIPKLNPSGVNNQWENYYFKYDQLNRIKQRAHYIGTTTASTPVFTADQSEAFNYDGNGNITTANRQGDSGSHLDNFAYHYNANTNQLNYVAGAWGASETRSPQSANNYHYDAIGNLTSDSQTGLTNVNWTVYGKIQEIDKATGNLTYTYDPAGQRESKKLNDTTTYYVRDAQGNPLGIYQKQGSTITWKEQHLYGSSRLGMFMPDTRLGTDSSYTSWNQTGLKRYEWNNHLGNQLATVTDKLIQHSSNSTSIDYYTADITTAQDYCAFGGLMQGKQYNAGGYRYGFNGKENDNDVGKGVGGQQDYGMRIYDPVVGRFLSVDPLSRSYPWNSTYTFAENRVISGIDLDGGEYVDINGNGTGPLNEEYAKKTGAKLLPGFSTKPVLNVPKGIIILKTVPEEIIAMPDMNGTGRIGPNHIVLTTVAAVRQDYINAVGDNVRNGPIGALTWYVGGDKATFVGAIFDGAIMASSGIREPVFQTDLELTLTQEQSANNRTYNPNKPALLKANINIPASRNGGAPDFSSTPYLYESVPGQFNLAKIKLTGSYSDDFAEANRAANLPKTPRGYTWHHLDDYDNRTGMASLQLVKTDVHQKTVPHMGSIKQYEINNHIKYKN